MTLTSKHINYKNDCRQMFVGQTIRAVIYGELKYFADENGNNINPLPYYKSKYPDIDTLDHSIYFKTDNKTVYVFWDNTFTCYGLQSKQLDFAATTNHYEQKWDVSSEPKWIDFIGQKIIDFKILWEESWTSNPDGTNKFYTTYPQTFEIIIETGKSFFITALELKDDEDEYYTQMDNLLVTTNFDLLKQLEIQQQKYVEKYHSRKSTWSKLFGQ
jgi:hypothetical protein